MKDATLKELRRGSIFAKPSQLLQSCDKKQTLAQSQGFKANPGLEFANAFSVSGLVMNVEQSLS
jgi:hypothetical protein